MTDTYESLLREAKRELLHRVSYDGCPLLARIDALLATCGKCEAIHVANTSGGTDWWCHKCERIRVSKCYRGLPEKESDRE